jgi:hypothetical protein
MRSAAAGCARRFLFNAMRRQTRAEEPIMQEVVQAVQYPSKQHLSQGQFGTPSSIPSTRL